MLSTDRLKIRPFEDADIDAVFEMRSDPEIMRYIREPQTKKQETYNWVAMISAQLEATGIGFCAVIDKETDRFAGWAGLWILKETSEIEVGYAVHRDFWGKGYATEAAKRVLEYAFDDLGLDRVVAVAYPENSGSIKVMKKLGMTCVGVGRFYDQDLVQYAIKESEFRSQESAGTEAEDGGLKTENFEDVAEGDKSNRQWSGARRADRS